MTGIVTVLTAASFQLSIKSITEAVIKYMTFSKNSMNPKQRTCHIFSTSSFILDISSPVFILSKNENESDCICLNRSILIAAAVFILAKSNISSFK